VTAFWNYYALEEARLDAADAHKLLVLPPCACSRRSEAAKDGVLSDNGNKTAFAIGARFRSASVAIVNHHELDLRIARRRNDTKYRFRRWLSFDDLLSSASPEAAG
jgi:hypothetical protein